MTLRCWRCQSRGSLPRKAANREWKQPKRRKCVAVSKAERTERAKSPLISNMETQSLEFALLGFGLALVQHVLTTISFFSLGMEMFSVTLYVEKGNLRITSLLGYS